MHVSNKDVLDNFPNALINHTYRVEIFLNVHEIFH